MPHKSICCIQTNALEDEFNTYREFPCGFRISVRMKERLGQDIPS